MEERGYKKKIRSASIVLIVFLWTPLLPFIGIILCSIFLLFTTGPIIALLYAITIDAFLVPAEAPLWVRSTSYVVISLIPYVIARYSISI